MNILVTGANGQLGNEMRIVSQQSAHHYIFTDVAELDITDAAAVEKMVADNDVKVIVNCAAYTNVDKAEDDRELAELLNAKAVENLAVAIRRNDGLLVHVSTDYVFGGTRNNTPCREEEAANPTGVYGETKLHGEEAVIRSGCHYLIIRTAWLYSEYGKNFLKTMLDLTATKPSLKVVFDQTGTPTYAYDLAAAICDIIEQRKYEGRDGIYHYSNEGVCSWYDFTKAIAEYAGHTACDIQPCHSDEFPSKVIRPSYSVLDKTKIKTTFGLKVPYWTDSLKQCIDNLQHQ
ncbi:MAG TPA: dTDP-4-dehydrorhamnose reductase [Candidatus Barnesiella excrementipullorum]|uniref:dTDP-4-dehydrorhamnose reductase n=1 Tax=Candidatus Barnesiella excrementipullorum TaxID=2838479 RepID=A0A9D1VQG5_9BACT|nr:dTDP-4-dehydrorhamnose reductase [Candidatus Barnesiella excrementipullorum]